MKSVLAICLLLIIQSIHPCHAGLADRKCPLLNLDYRLIKVESNSQSNDQSIDPSINEYVFSVTNLDHDIASPTVLDLHMQIDKQTNDRTIDQSINRQTNRRYILWKSQSNNQIAPSTFNQSFYLAADHSVSFMVTYTVNGRRCHSETMNTDLFDRSSKDLSKQPNDQTINQTDDQTNNQSINQSIEQTADQSINQTADQSIEQDASQVDQTVYQSLNRGPKSHPIEDTETAAAVNAHQSLTQDTSSQTINPTIEQSTNQLADETINQAVARPLDCEDLLKQRHRTSTQSINQTAEQQIRQKQLDRLLQVRIRDCQRRAAAERQIEHNRVESLKHKWKVIDCLIDRLIDHKMTDDSTDMHVIDRLIDRLINQQEMSDAETAQLDALIDQPSCQSNNQSINQSNGQQTVQSSIQPNDQSNNQSISHSVQRSNPCINSNVSISLSANSYVPTMMDVSINGLDSLIDRLIDHVDIVLISRDEQSIVQSINLSNNQISHVSVNAIKVASHVNPKRTPHLGLSINQSISHSIRGILVLSVDNYRCHYHTGGSPN